MPPKQLKTPPPPAMNTRTRKRATNPSQAQSTKKKRAESAAASPAISHALAVQSAHSNEDECIVVEEKDLLVSWDTVCKGKDPIWIPLDQLRHDFSVRKLRQHDVVKLVEKFSIGLQTVRGLLVLF